MRREDRGSCGRRCGRWWEGLQKQKRREFCAKRGMALTRFDYWRRQFPPSRLVKVEVTQGEAVEQSFTLAWATGGASKVPGVGDEELSRLIRIAKRA